MPKSPITPDLSEKPNIEKWLNINNNTWGNLKSLLAYFERFQDKRVTHGWVDQKNSPIYRFGGFSDPNRLTIYCYADRCVVRIYIEQEQLPDGFLGIGKRTQRGFKNQIVFGNDDNNAESYKQLKLVLDHCDFTAFQADFDEAPPPAISINKQVYSFYASIAKAREASIIHWKEKELERKFVLWLKHQAFSKCLISEQQRSIDYCGQKIKPDIMLFNSDNTLNSIVEVKHLKTSKEDIKHAIGQLLMYSLHGEIRCRSIWIVGNEAPNKKDKEWFSRLKGELFNFSIKYFCACGDGFREVR
ncbi:hypothetical protein L3V43_23140 [Pseudoalteromonas sp. L23]|uniref:hypothetical protein n=1 Tax=unclassified Pseudoalteromonas TaxID=194690 RepID=UPI001EF15746|nr:MULTISPECIES: hypothetical protein [unclassified Pseudoalteromonas]MCF7516496.1 hypothetical protein [Pseudoalteromonas sp. L7]MCF7528531.1 hypothetical protein [Pseudoalteromonas sp. L23]